ncbi:DUF2059 domain-containing protein [Bradyrhizobium liaoningense]|uniref:DUF2059 domain-containing protein n=1 Tax=Bradyrhizobium liaoningense TaxID=43992 RepID=UPI001BAD3EB0|nr:DUF2059 domain-containing protein [Bradyrhizobium liaoningense]MBR0820281.1 DUF2059 domain-containing protein [Bradyrhizobium liaoningense]
MASDRPEVDLLLASGSENPKRIFAALNVEPTKPKKDVVISNDEAHAFIRKRYDGLSSSEIAEASTFLNSEQGIKQRELSKEFSQLVPRLLSGATSINEAPALKAEKVRQFLEAAGAIDALNSIPLGEAKPESRSSVCQYAINFYADRLSEEELDSLVTHYSSAEGKAAVKAALRLAKDILQEYGI